MKKNILKNYKNSYKFYIPYEMLLNDGIVLNKNSGFQATFKIRFKDLNYLGQNEITQIMNQLNNAYKRLPDGYSFHWDVIRSKSDKYPKKDLTDKPIPTQIIDIMREDSVKNGTFYITELYLTITYLMQTETTDKLDELMEKFKSFLPGKKIKKNTEEKSVLLKKFNEELKEFKDTVDLFISQFYSVTEDIKKLENDELLGYLYSAVNLEKLEKMRTPKNNYIMLDEVLSNSTITNGENFKMNDDYVKVITINAFPDAVMPRVFDALENFDFEYRYVTRFIMLEREEALKMLRDFQLYFNAKTKTFFQWLVEAATQKEITKVDTTAVNNVDESTLAEEELKTGNLAYGYYTFSFIIKDKNLENLDKKVQEVKKALAFYDFVGNEDKYNRFDTLIGSLPGNITNNIRRMPMNTYLLSALAPMSSLYTGHRYNKYLKDIALFTTKTEKELFYFNIHNGDIGHTLIVGPSGAGKSFLLGMIASNFMKYDWQKPKFEDYINENGKRMEKITGYEKKNSQVFFFDKDSSSKVLTITSGGKFYDLGNNEVAFQPLKDIHIESEKEWALGWILSILEQEGIPSNAMNRNLVWEALKSLSNAPRELRTLSNLSSTIQSHEMRNALSIYCGENAYGQYFDNNIDDMSDSNIITFEMGNVIKTKKVVAPLLDYVFHRIEKEKLDGTPTCIVLDECWLFLNNDKMRAKIVDWLKTLRKKNTSIVLATQSLMDIKNSPIFADIMDNCQTKIFLPNKMALSTWLDLYKDFNLSEVEIQEINDGVAKQDYFIKTNDGSRLFELSPTRTEIAYIGSSLANDLTKITEIRDKVENMLLNDKDKVKLINKEWIDYKRKEGLSISEVMKYKELLFR